MNYATHYRSTEHLQRSERRFGKTISNVSHIHYDVAYWQQIIDVELNKKRNFREYDFELLMIAQEFLKSWKSLKRGRNW